MPYYYCTCSNDVKRRKAVANGRTPFRSVEVDRDGVCLDCGYYAVAYHSHIGPRDGRLYDVLFKEIEEPKPDHYMVKGGLSLKSQLQNKRNLSDKSGESKDGDLDV